MERKAAEELENRLKEQLARYPQLQITDLVKLVYQNEFGGGHLIADKEKSLQRIREEYAGLSVQGITPPDRQAERMEAIGNGICRLSLECLHDGLRPETLNEMFVQSAAEISGSVDRFEEKLELLKTLCTESRLQCGKQTEQKPLCAEQTEQKPLCREQMEQKPLCIGLTVPEILEEYLERYRREGYPPVSHSDCYRKHYHPAYRIITEHFRQIYPICLEIDRMLAHKGSEETVTVAIDGPCGGGKTTLARLLKGIYDCNVFSMDDFFLRQEQRTKKRYAEPGGNVDYERFRKEVLDHLGDFRGIGLRAFDCEKMTLCKERRVPHKRLNVVEGVYSCHPYFGEDAYDLRFFAEVEKGVQKERIRKRNGEKMLQRFLEEWIPYEETYFAAYRIREKCRSIELHF